jgi:hypothetical protein
LQWLNFQGSCEPSFSTADQPKQRENKGETIKSFMNRCFYPQIFN